MRTRCCMPLRSRATGCCFCATPGATTRSGTDLGATATTSGPKTRRFAISFGRSSGRMARSGWRGSTSNRSLTLCTSARESCERRPRRPSTSGRWPAVRCPPSRPRLRLEGRRGGASARPCPSACRGCRTGPRLSSWVWARSWMVESRRSWAGMRPRATSCRTRRRGIGLARRVARRTSGCARRATSATASATSSLPSGVGGGASSRGRSTWCCLRGR
mmetsp:Transcript_159160/g.510510  ORF Transcript_159160/g.510510 Transcript_159160/m.510510 type:complete len:218 (-) Transcript_159160:826-1479(-)